MAGEADPAGEVRSNHSMKRSAIPLRDKHLAAGEATAEEIARCGRFAEDARSQAISYAPCG